MKSTRLKLSGDWLAIYRFVLLPMVLLFLLVGGSLFTMAYLSGAGDPWPIFWIALMAVVSIALAFRTPEVYFDKDNLYVVRFFSTTIYDLRKVRRLNGCDHALDREFQIEFFMERGSILKIDYLPPRREARFYYWNKEFTGVAKVFVQRISELQADPPVSN